MQQRSNHYITYFCLENVSRLHCYLIIPPVIHLKKEEFAKIGGFKIGGRVTNKLSFADDTAIIAKIQEELHTNIYIQREKHRERERECMCVCPCKASHNYMREKSNP